MTGRPRIFGRVVAGAITLAFSFLLVARSIGTALPSTDTSLFDAKLNEFSEADPPNDVIFVGSSRVYRHVRPATFDSVLAAEGISVHSYNFGVPGTNAFEIPYQLRAILKREQAARIQWIFVALEGLEWNMEELNLASDRVSRYFGWRTFLRGARLLAANDAKSASDRRDALLARVSPLFHHVTGYARGGTWLRGRIEPRRSSDDPLLAGHESGFQSLDSAYAHAKGAVREALDIRIETYTRNRERRALRKGRVDRDSTDVSYQAPVLADLLEEIDSIARDHGAEVVFFERNWGSGAPDLKAMFRSGEIEHLISLEDPAKYPGLRDARRRFDGGHFNAEGAEILTRYLAEAFVSIAREKRVRP